MRRRVLALLAVLAASGTGVGVAAALDGDRSAAPRVSRTVAASGPPIVCQGASTPAAPDLTTRPPDPELVAALGVLRRPRTAADEVPEKALASLARPHVRGANVEAARLIREEPGGGRAWLVPVEDAVPRDVPPWRCVRRLRGEARERAIAMRRQVLRRPALPGAVVVAEGDAVAPQGGTTEVIRSGRAFLTASCTGPARTMTTVAGILPDGIDRVHIHQAGGMRVDAAVEDNAFGVLLPPASRAGTLTAVFTDATGKTVRRPLGEGGIRHCAPRSTTSTSRPHAPRRSPDGGAVELRTEPLDRGTGPVLAGVVRRPSGRRCLAVGPPLPREDARAPGVVPDASDLRCTSVRDLRRRRVVAGAVRLPGGVTVLTGFADRRRIRWLGVEGGHEGLRVTVSRSGAFAVAWRRELARGGTWRIRAALRGSPVRMTAPITVRLRAKRPNEATVPRAGGWGG